MKLIVESGASKSNWITIMDQTILDRQKHAGINLTSNPYSIEVLNTVDFINNKDIKEIYFYGAGLSALSAKKRLSEKLAGMFENASVEIQTDILAAARAVSHKSESIVSILGTGMNCVVFNGAEIVHQSRSLGYLISDDGSGFNIGRLIIKAYFQKTMPEKDSLEFEKQYNIHERDLIVDIYKSSKPNYLIAQISKFLNHSSRVFRTSILEENFDAFFKNQILPLNKYNNFKLTFVGSIAETFQNELLLIAKKYGRGINKIIKDPIEGLIEYHKQN